MPKASTLATSSPATVTALREVLGVQDVLATVNIYDDTTAGLAATSDGDYFSVPSDDEDEYQILYKNEEGSATEIKRYPSGEYITTKAAEASASAQAASDSADAAAETVGSLAASTGSSLVGFAQSGTGAVTRTLEGKAQERVTPEDFGGDITKAATAASARGVPLHLGPTYTVSAVVVLAADVSIVGHPKGTRITSTDASAYVFSTTAENVRIENVTAVGAKGLLNITANFEEISVIGGGLEGVADTAINRGVMVDSGVTGTTLRVQGAKLTNCTPLYADNFACDDLYFDDNTVTDATQWIVRCLTQPQSGDPDTATAPERIWFRRNKIRGINTGLTDKSVVARVVQASAKQEIIYEDNSVYHLNTTNAGDVCYWLFGSLRMSRNRFARIESTTIPVDQKANGAAPTRTYHHKVTGNVFDQSEVESADDNMEAMIRFYSESNMECRGNTFIGLRCPTHMIWHSVDLGITMENFTLENETIYDHKYPVCVVLLQQSKNTTISGFKVNGISNPGGVTYNSETRCRLVDIVHTFDNGLGIENVHISDNKMHTADTNAVIAHIFPSAAAPTGFIDNITIENNKLPVGAAIARFNNGSAIGKVSMAGNIGPNTTLFIGSTPSDFQHYGNLPELKGSTTWDPGSIGAGLSSSTTLTVTGAALGDLVQATSSLDLGGLIMTARVYTTNGIRVTLSNPTGGAIDLASMTIRVVVRKSY